MVKDSQPQIGLPQGELKYAEGYCYHITPEPSNIILSQSYSYDDILIVRVMLLPSARVVFDKTCGY